MRKLLTNTQIKQRIQKVKKTEGLESVSALADIYHAFVLRRYRRFRDNLRENPEELDKRRVKYCHDKVKYYVKELEKLVKIAKKMRDLEKKAKRSKKGKFMAARIKKQADEAERVCKLYGKEVRRLF
jgi:putative lipoic acid-binding regulatory protein